MSLGVRVNPGTKIEMMVVGGKNGVSGWSPKEVFGVLTPGSGLTGCVRAST